MIFVSLWIPACAGMTVGDCGDPGTSPGQALDDGL